MISTPLSMEKPVRSPMVPPIKPNWASIVTFKSAPIVSGKQNVKKCLARVTVYMCSDNALCRHAIKAVIFKKKNKHEMSVRPSIFI